MKKYLLIPLLAAACCFSSFKSDKAIAAKTASTSKAQLFDPRGWILDDTGNYTVYVDTPNPTYYGSFCCGNVVLSIKNNSTSAFFSATSQLGSIVSDPSGDMLEHAKARFIENGATVEIFFSGTLN